MAIPQVPEQDPSQDELWLPNVINPYLNVWWTTQTVSDVPESVMGWLVAQGFEVTGVSEDSTTVPPTKYFALTRQGMRPQDVILSLCNSYTIAANEARSANQIRYNQIVADWKEMIETSHDQFAAQTTEQNTQAGVYIADLDRYMNEVDALIAENQSQIFADAETAKISLGQMDARLSDLEANAQNTSVIVTGLLSSQETSLQTFLSDYNGKLLELDQNFAAQLAKVLADISSLGTILDSHATSYSQQFDILASNYAAHATNIDSLLSDITANVGTYTAEVDAILSSLDSDYQTTETDLATIRTGAGTLVNEYASDYQTVLNLLSSDYETHAGLARDFLNSLGATDLVRINQQFAAALASQVQQLTNRGYYSSSMITDITLRNQRERDEQIQLLNDRLMREKLDNQHKLYEQQVAMRARTLDGTDRLHSVRQEVLRYQATLITSVYSLLQEARNRILAGKQAIFAARDANGRFAVSVRSDLYARLQDVRQRTIESADRIYQLRDVFAKWSNTETNRLYEQLQQIEAQHIAGIDRQFAAKQDVNRGQISQRDILLQQLQDALKGLLAGKERYASLLVQNATALADQKSRAVVEKMNVSVQRLDGWSKIADQNRALMAYQLDTRNQLLIGLYNFVERRDDIAPEWKDMAQMIAGLGDSGGGWLSPN